MPQLNPEFFISQIFWLCITFGCLFIFLWKYSLPRIHNVLEKRSKKIIGSSLEADVKITLPKVEFDLLQKIDAQELFITSNVLQSISKEKSISVTVKKAKGTKCSRCWKIVKEVKNNKCLRCSKIK